MLYLTDIIFCIYLYQRWIYRVDPKRVNEFGTSGEMLDPQQVADGQNGAVPAIDSSTNDNEAAATDVSEAAATDVSDDAPELSAEPEKSTSEKKTD